MSNLGGQTVNILGFGQRKTGAWVSTTHGQPGYQTQWQRVKEVFIHKVIPAVTPHVSPAKITQLPPTEHYFYPVSTAPTNSHNQRKLKKGNK